MTKHNKDDFDRVAKKLGDLDIPEHVEDLPDELPLEEPEKEKKEEKEDKEEKKEVKEEKKEAKKEVKKKEVKQEKPEEIFGFKQRNSFVHGFRFGLGFWLASIIMIIVLMFVMQLLQSVWWRIF